MIKLATVFSGIGAIEHALVRMGVKHKVVFACDNGDVDILTKQIGMNIDEIQSEIVLLDTLVSKLRTGNSVDDLYKQQLLGMFNELNAEYKKINKSLKSITSPYSNISSVLDTIIKMSMIKPARKKEYTKFKAELSAGSLLQKRLKEFQVILEVSNDFKKDNSNYIFHLKQKCMIFMEERSLKLNALCLNPT